MNTLNTVNTGCQSIAGYIDNLVACHLDCGYLEYSEITYTDTRTTCIFHKVKDCVANSISRLLAVMCGSANN